VEKDHDVANDLLLGPGALDALTTLSADSINVYQPCRFLLDDVENLLAELRDQLLCVNVSDSFNHAASQIFLDAFLSCRRGAVEHHGLELESKLADLNPAAFGGYPFSGADRGERADFGHQVAVPLRFHL
jgi:hypothetical protein